MVRIRVRETLVVFSWLRFLVAIVTIIRTKKLRRIRRGIVTTIARFLLYLLRAAKFPPLLFRLESEVEQRSAPSKIFAVIILTTA